MGILYLEAGLHWDECIFYFYFFTKVVQAPVSECQFLHLHFKCFFEHWLTFSTVMFSKFLSMFGQNEAYRNTTPAIGCTPPTAWKWLGSALALGDLCEDKTDRKMDGWMKKHNVRHWSHCFLVPALLALVYFCCLKKKNLIPIFAFISTSSTITHIA